MPLQVVYADRRQVERERQRLGHAGAHQQRAGKSRTLGIGDGIEITQAASGVNQYFFSERQHAPDVVARSQFRHHAAVFRMHADLRMQGMRQQAGIRVIKRDAGLVAGGFDA